MKKGLTWILILLCLLAQLPACASIATAQTPLNDPDSARAENIRLAAWSINQTTLLYGETFSFNAIVGPRSEEAGYAAAPNGRGVEVIGGGVGQAASALYLAVADLTQEGVEIDALSVYGERYCGDYVSSGDQAVLVDYSAGVDLCFTNYAADEMLIEMWISEDSLCCTVSLSNWESERKEVANNSFVSRSSAPAADMVRLSEIRMDCEGDEALVSNVALAADSICDISLTAGDTFSFNEIVGPREEDYGYRPALNGRGVEVVGGGVGQVASAVWLSIKNLPDFSIVEKSTYGTKYNQSYVDNSADAILIDYSAGTDFAFRYNGSGCVTFYTRVEDGELCCSIYETE